MRRIILKINNFHAFILQVNPSKGLFHFGPEHRPVPLEQTFIGVTEKQRIRQQVPIKLVWTLARMCQNVVNRNIRVRANLLSQVKMRVNFMF